MMMMDKARINSRATSSSSTSAEDAARALRGHGVIGHGVIEEICAAHSIERILAWCAHAAKHPSITAGGLVEAIRAGHEPPSPVDENDAQAAYGVEIVSWLRAKLPEVCVVPASYIESVRAADGEQAAAQLIAHAQHNTPHYAAVAAVIRLHHQVGRILTVKAHGPEIRQAVADWYEEMAAHNRQLVEILSQRSGAAIPHTAPQGAHNQQSNPSERPAA
jgi:hypothetical protein